ncbi:MAG: phosphate ABC transporter permease PstA [Phormidium sp. BM_Day4_Bin.17]|nr:phosphate ABC transporter permease PstA [Phormidium sp. BM_Day4_Bin.17]UCJ12684.1 MAG: phosphate ABC transporter permease PstA [Phormidium sp. PBR-2020]
MAVRPLKPQTLQPPSDPIDVLMALLTWGTFALILGLLAWLLGDIVKQGLPHLNWAFISTVPEDAGRRGGILPILLSTAWIVGISLAVALPLGLATALWLSEFARSHPKFKHSLNLSLDILAAMPSIVFGLFGNAMFCQALGFGFSILSGGLTLACMILPITVRTSQNALQTVPQTYRQVGAGLGLSKTALLRVVILPVALPGLSVGLLLGLGRAMAETAALIFTSGYVTRMPNSIWDSGRSLSIHIYDLALNIPGGEASASSTALVLIGLLVVINSIIMALASLTQTHNSNP